MTEENQQIDNEAPFSKYFTMMLNMADDDLNPYEYRLLAHYVRIGGDVYETTKTTAMKTKMSSGKVSQPGAP